MAILGCSRTTDPKTTAAVSSTDQTQTGTETVASGKTINTFTQTENPRFSKEVRGLYTNGVSNTVTCTAWPATVWLILVTLLME